MNKKISVNQRPHYAQVNPFAPAVAGVPQIESDWIINAVVVDVILNEDHPEFDASGYGVGSVKFRDIGYQLYRRTEDLHWAMPLYANDESFPLKNELINVFSAFNKFYYIRTVNIGYRPTTQAFYDLISEGGPPITENDRIKEFQRSSSHPKNVTVSNTNVLGDYFLDLPNINHLRHWEGDRIIEGRSGQSIRLGSSWTSSSIYKSYPFQSLKNNQSPNILFRVGQSPRQVPVPNTMFGRVVEDVNNDLVSLWLVTDQVVPLQTATSTAAIHNKSVRFPPTQWSGNQFVANSERIILNAKRNEIFIYSSDGCHISTNSDATIDAANDFLSFLGRNHLTEITNYRKINVGSSDLHWSGQDFIYKAIEDINLISGRNIRLHAGNQYSIVSPKIFIGSENDRTQPMVLGTELIRVLRDIIMAHLESAASYVITAAGPGAISADVVNRLNSVLDRLESILSKDNYVSKINTLPATPGSKWNIYGS